MRGRLGHFFFLCCAAFLIGRLSAGPKYEPKIDPANFQGKVDHRYFPLVPGTSFRYLDTVLGELLEREVTVTSESKTVLGVRCVVVHEVVGSKGAIKEDTYDWFAQDKQGNVWYFGETTIEQRPLGPSSAGSWEAGVKGALPGIFMPAETKPGPAYRQNYYANWSEDMGQIIGIGETVSVPGGTFANCLCTKEWSLLESGGEKRWYAPGVGFIRSEGMGETVVLVSVTRP
ncbi:MAG: hypothetical protein ABIU29_01005 [Chthoniobacterales bacterium]